MEFRFGELFCGPGGLGWAARTTSVADANGLVCSMRHEWASDIDGDSCETYRLNICPDHPESVLQTPVEELDIENLPRVDAFAYGFPCNDFSVVGEHRGFEGEYGPLYTYGLRVLRAHRPLWFLAENVGGIRSANEGGAFARILSDLASAGDGYRLTPHLYKFEEYGVPQQRHRVIIVGVRRDLSVDFRVPAPTTVEPGEQVTAREAICVPPIAEDAANHEFTRQSPRVVERLRHIPPGKNAWCDELPEELRLNVKGARLSQIYKRLEPNKPAYTVTGSGGGGTHVYHWDEPRALTNRERARLQTFPDDFVFVGKKESVRRQIGMAVPPRGASVILEAILKSFAGVEYTSVSNSVGLESAVPGAQKR